MAGHLVVGEETTVRLPSRGASRASDPRLHRLTAGRQALNLETGVRLSVELSLHPRPQSDDMTEFPDDATTVRESEPYREFDDGRIRVFGYSYDAMAVSQIKT